MDDALCCVSVITKSMVYISVYYITYFSIISCSVVLGVWYPVFLKKGLTTML